MAKNLEVIVVGQKFEFLDALVGMPTTPRVGDYLDVVTEDGKRNSVRVVEVHWRSFRRIGWVPVCVTSAADRPEFDLPKRDFDEQDID